MSFLSLLPALLGIGGDLIQGANQSSAESSANQAASAATAGENQLAGTQSQAIQALLNQYTNVFQPLQTQVGSQYSGLSTLPTQQTAQYVISNLLQPFEDPWAAQQVRQQNLTSQTQGIQNILSQLGGAISPDQAQRLIQNTGENMVTTDAATNQGIMSQNLLQGQTNQQTALSDLLNMLQQSGAYSQTGQNLTGQAMSGLSGLTNLYANNANNATNAAGTISSSNPYGNIASLVQNYVQGLPAQTAAGQSTAPAANYGSAPSIAPGPSYQSSYATA